MSFLEVIAAVRKQPKHVRSAYAFWIAAVCTAVLLVIWVTTIPARLALFSPSEIAVSADDEPASAPEAAEPGRWGRLTASLQQAFGGDTENEVMPTVGEAALPPAVVMPELSPDTLAATKSATTTPLVWTEQVAAAKTYTAAEARPVLIATTSSMVAATTSSSTNVVQ